MAQSLRFDRRRMLQLLGALPLVGCGHAPPSTADQLATPRLPDAALPDAGQLTCLTTQPDAVGPFHESGAPLRKAIAEANEPGEPLVIRGAVLGPDCKTPLVGARLDIWQADASGVYHRADVRYRLRGQLLTDALGRYELQTIRPGHYDNRPRHIHLIVTQPGYAPLTTQVYFKGDPLLGRRDSCQPPTCHSHDPARQIALSGPSGAAGLQGTFDIILAKG